VSSLAGRRIDSVTARGKHLLIALDDGRVIHSHMGMTGSWHIYRPGEAWRKPATRAAMSIDCRDVCAVCFTPRLLEVLTASALRRHDYLNRLGPDLLAPAALESDVLPRFRRVNNLPIGEAVMNQTVVSGIGNVYKSEILFSLRLHPLTPVSALSDEIILRLVTDASRLMAQNLGGRPRTTRHALDGGRYHVYGRGGEACYRCGTAIVVTRQGDAGRTTYFCPVCQPRREARQSTPSPSAE